MKLAKFVTVWTSLPRFQVKLLEEKNTDLMERNVELEEDVKKTGSWRPQVRRETALLRQNNRV